MKKTLLLGVASLLFGFVNAQVDCNIANIQGGFAGGYLDWSLDESGIYTFIDPADDYTIGQSCGATYPYTIETVNFSIADGTAFGEGDGTGTFVYSIGIYALDGGDPCNPPGTQLATSGPISVDLTGAGLTAQSITFNFDVNDAFFVSYEPISWTGLATEVPSILWDAVARPLCVQQMTIDDGVTWTDFTEFFDGGETGWADFTIFGTSDTGSGGNCETGNLTNAAPEDLCPDESTDIASVIPTSFPPGGGQGVLLTPGPDGTGALNGEFVLTGVTFPYTLDAGLNGVLEANMLEDLAGTWDVSIAVYSDTGAPIDNICSQSDIKTVVFLDASDPACEATGGDACADWVSPTPETGYIDFTNEFGGAPCNDGGGCPFNEIDLFEVWQSEAYAMENIQQGAEYTFSHCNGPGAGSWIPEYTIIAPSGAIDAFGAGDGDGCSITWTASEEGTYLIVINEAGACGVSGSDDNGFPAITCNGVVECPDLGNSVCEGATPVSEGAHTYDAISGNGFFDGCFVGATGAQWFVYTPAADGFVLIKSCGQVDTRLSVFTGDCDNLECYASNDDDDDLNCEPDGFASSVEEMPVTAGTNYYIMWDDRWSSESSDWEITFIPPPDCDEPTATAAIDFSNCPLPEFNVLVDLTGIGDALSVDIVESVNGGVETVVHNDVSAIQEYLMGPYAMGDEVTISIVHNEDGACTIELGSFTAPGCPPDNDTCEDAVAISCGETLTGTNVNATPFAETCIGNNTAGGVWYSFVGTNSDDPGAADGTPGDQVTMSTCSQADYDTKIDIYSGSCGALSCVAGNDDGEDCENLTSVVSFATLVGEPYYVFVSGWNDGSSGTFDLSMTCAPACLPTPENDDCATAESLTVQNAGEGVPTLGSNECAANALDNPSCNAFATIQDVWYTFNSGEETSLVLIANMVEMTDLRVVVYEGSCDGEEILCQAPFNSPEILTLNANTDYFVQVYSNGTAGQGTFEIMVESVPAPPVNDDCANAISVDCNTVVSGQTVFATSNDAPADCDVALNTAPGVWYTVEGIDGTLTASLCGSEFDTKIGVFSGVCGELTCIIGEDDDFPNCDSNDPSVDWAATAGEIYYVYVTGFGTSSGSFDLSIVCDDSEPTEECTDWVNPSSTTGWSDFNTEFEGAPTPDGDGNCETFTIDAFEVWQSEAYAMDNITAGVEYTFSHCDGPGAGSWIPEYTIIAPSGAIDAFGAGDGDGCSISWVASETGTYLIVINEAGACGVAGNDDNGFPSITCGGDPQPTEECTDWVNPSSTTGWSDFNTEFEGAPTPDGDGNCETFTIDAFEVWQSEAYAMDNVTEGVEYTFSHCDGPGAGSWIPEYTIITPSGAIDAFGAGDGDGCSISWVASETGTYLIVINEAGACGVAGNDDNGFPSITCNGNTSVEETTAVDFAVFPNPNNGQFTLNYSGENGVALIHVLDISGKAVFSEQMTMTTNTRLDIDLGNGVSGMYFVRLTMDEEVKVVKVIVQ